jgi:hypothetical protein
MKVIRQDDNGIDRKGALLPSYAKRGAKGADMIDKPRRPTFRECYREEVGSALNAVAWISDHSGMISRISLRSSGLRAALRPGHTSPLAERRGLRELRAGRRDVGALALEKILDRAT